MPNFGYQTQIHKMMDKLFLAKNIIAKKLKSDSEPLSPSEQLAYEQLEQIVNECRVSLQTLSDDLGDPSPKK